MTSFIVCPLPKTFGRITFFFPYPVDQTLLGNFVMLENRLQAV